MIPSKYQTAIYRTYENTNSNIFINATAGSGKSHSIREMLKKTSFFKLAKTLLVAFTRNIMEEQKDKVPFGVHVKTVHSLGFGVLNKNTYGKFKIIEDNGLKTFILAKQVIKNRFKGQKNEYKLFNTYLFVIAQLYKMYRLNLSTCKREDLENLVNTYDIEVFCEEFFYEDTVTTINYIQEYNNKQLEEKMVDFTDMLWLPYQQVTRQYFPKFENIFIDEVQDINPLQRELLLKCRQRRGRIIVVGDDKQGIYSFLGANLESLNYFKNMPNTVNLDLSVSYRLPKMIVELANDIFPNSVEYYEENPEGKIINDAKIEDIREGDMVLCRNNLPLIETFIELIVQGKNAMLLGKDFEKKLVSLINMVNSVDGLDNLLIQKENNLKEKEVKKPKQHKQYIVLKEKIDIIKLILNKTNYCFSELIDLFNIIFINNKSSESVVTLSTIHGAKGLEAKRVFWLKPSLIPSQHAKTPLALYQEKCLKFVCVTRVQEELYIIN